MAKSKVAFNEKLECQSINVSKNNASVRFNLRMEGEAPPAGTVDLNLNFRQGLDRGQNFNPGEEYEVIIKETGSDSGSSSS